MEVMRKGEYQYRDRTPIPKLKRCPFCGTNMNYSPVEGLFGWHKESCFFQFLQNKEVDMCEKEIQLKFIEAWNRRI